MPRKRLNVKLLFWTLASLVLFGTGVHLLHGFQTDRQARALFAQAVQAEKDGRHDRAAVCLSRYLLLSPDDVTALARYGLVLEKLPESPRTSWHILTMFRRILADDPSRHAVRRRLVLRAMKLDLYDEAQEHLDVLVRVFPRDGALEDLRGQCQEARGKYARAANSYARAIRHAPRRIECYARLADVLRQHLGRAARAERVLDALVKANPKSAQAYLVRARQHAAQGLAARAAADLARARELAPSDAAVLTASAELARQQGDLDGAARYWRRGQQLHPRDLGTYLGLAGLELQGGHPRRAIAWLRRGLKHLPDHPDLLHLLTETLIGQGEPAEAGREIARLRRGGRHLLLADYLDARVLMGRRQWLAASRLLEEVSRAPDLPDDLAGRTQLALGRCCEKMGDFDRRLAAYLQAVELDPASLDGRLRLGEALLDAARGPEAVAQYRLLTASPVAPGTCWLMLAHALFQTNWQLPAHKRNWKELEQVLERAAGVPGQAAAAAVLRADVLLARGLVERARALLEQACEKQPDQVVLWQARANLAERGGDPHGAEQLWEQAGRELLPSADLSLALVQFWSGRGGREAARHLAEVEESLGCFPAADRRRLRGELAEGYFRLGALADAERLGRRLAHDSPADLDSRLLLLELALQTGRDRAAAEMIGELRKLEGEEGAWWRYGEAGRLLTRAQQGDRSGLVKARTLLREAVRRRPGWSRVPLLLARLEELEGRPEQALEGYLRAIDLGEHRPAVVGRAVQILAGSERYREADQVVLRYQRRAPLGRDLARLAAEIAVKARRYERAEELARLAVPAGLRDYRAQLWLGALLASAGRPAEAEEAIRRATRLAGSVPDPWVALVAHLVRTGQAEAAEATLAEVGTALPPDVAPLALAQGYEALGRVGRAEEEYGAAVARRPNNFVVLEKAARFYLRVLLPRRAEPLLQALLDPDMVVPSAKQAWARRQLALVLAGNGTDAGYRTALALLGRNGTAAGPSVADQRARAFVEATRPGRRRRALRMLEDSISCQALTSAEQFRLTLLYEAENDWVRARAQMRAALTADGQNPAYLAHFLRGLLQHGKTAEARRWLPRLESLEPDAPRTRDFRARLEEMLRKVKASKGRGKGPPPARRLRKS
jgi:tetratricopeptide (TPR) repeat protein